MITTVYKNEFHDYFTRSDTYKNQFSYEAREIIFDYLEEYEASTGENVEFDLVAICCDFTESTIKEIIFDYGYLMDQESEKTQEYIEQFLYEHTQLCGSYVDSDGDSIYVYQQF
jgi:hypothetical protein